MTTRQAAKHLQNSLTHGDTVFALNLGNLEDNLNQIDTDDPRTVEAIKRISKAQDIETARAAMCDVLNRNGLYASALRVNSGEQIDLDAEANRECSH